MSINTYESALTSLADAGILFSIFDTAASSYFNPTSDYEAFQIKGGEL